MALERRKEPGEAWETVEASNGGSQTFLTATVPVSSAELLALNSAAKTIVAAPGAGKAIVPVSAFAQYVFATTAYDDLGNDIAIVWSGDEGNENADLGIAFEFGLITQTENGVSGSSNGLGAVALPQTTAENMALVAHMDNDDPILGDGSLVITVLYYVVDLV